MKFIKDGISSDMIIDNVFGVTRLAKEAIIKYGDQNVVNATIGALFDDQAKLVALDSVYNVYNNLDNKVKAKYADGFAGNKSFIEAINKWVFNDTDMNLSYNTLATPGGSGALSISMLNLLDKDDIVLAPNIAWGSYKLMAEQFNLQYRTYNLISEDSFDLNDFKLQVTNALSEKKRIMILINDPAHNPTGLSMGEFTWNKIIAFLNEFVDSEIIIVNDVAYLDYAYDQNIAKAHFKSVNHINDNILFLVAYSLSKSFTFYGVRLGSLFVCSKNEDTLQSVYNVLEKGCRSIWSNVNNAAMETFAIVMNEHYDEYVNELNLYIDKLKNRSSLFIKEAKECGLETYPYSDGFFVTIVKLDNKQRDIDHQKLINNNIYTIKVNQGIRVGICAISEEKVKGLAHKIKEIIG